MSHDRALKNPPLSVPNVGLPSQRLQKVETEYLLVCEASSTTLTDGQWRFSLEAADGELILEAEDQETGDINRLTLLAAVRGLESLEGSSTVTLLSKNRYLIRSLTNSLPRWRQNNFRWEHFGRRINVQHADLWKRMDRALSIHRVQACLISSCLVSAGSVAASSNSERSTSESAPSWNRIDAAHGSPVSNDSAQVGNHVPPPSDRLRRMLMGRELQNPPKQRVRGTNRFLPQDTEA